MELTDVGPCLSQGHCSGCRGPHASEEHSRLACLMVCRQLGMSFSCNSLSALILASGGMTEAESGVAVTLAHAQHLHRVLSSVHRTVVQEASMECCLSAHSTSQSCRHAVFAEVFHRMSRAVKRLAARLLCLGARGCANFVVPMLR